MRAEGTTGSRKAGIGPTIDHRRQAAIHPNFPSFFFTNQIALTHALPPLVADPVLDAETAVEVEVLVGRLQRGVHLLHGHVQEEGHRGVVRLDYLGRLLRVVFLHIHRGRTTIISCDVHL